MYLSIQEGKIFGERLSLQTLAANKCPTLNVVPSATETVAKADSYPVLSFPEKKWCFISLSASIIKINKTNKENSTGLPWLSFSPLEELRICGNFVNCLDIKAAWEGRLALPGGILDTCWYPHGMPYVNSDPCLLSLIKSLLQINKYPSKHDSLLTLLEKFPFGLSKNRAKNNWIFNILVTILVHDIYN